MRQALAALCDVNPGPRFSLLTTVTYLTEDKVSVSLLVPLLLLLYGREVGARYSQPTAWVTPTAGPLRSSLIRGTDR